MKKGDKIVLLLIVIIGISIFVYFNFFKKGNEATRAVIEVNGKVVKTFNLPQKDMLSYRVETDDHNYNIVQISGNKVRIKDANCPEKVCVSEGWKDTVGQTLVCIPHKLIVKIEGNKNSTGQRDVDIKTY